jgi:hypothetical protein
VFGRSAVAVSRARPSAHIVISENNPSNAGGVDGTDGRGIGGNLAG